MRRIAISNKITRREGSAIEKYFREISRIPRLTAEEEAALAARIKKGDKEALDRLVKANLKFVISIAKQYDFSKIPLSDLVNEGNMGLVKAAYRFDESRGHRFLTYAAVWIRHTLMQAVSDYSRIIRIPSNKAGELSRIYQALVYIEQRLEREPTIEELADFLGLSAKDIENASQALIRHSSLDAPLPANDEVSLLDILSEPDSVNTEKLQAGREGLMTQLKRLFSLLTSREYHVIKNYFGIGIEFARSIEDIAHELGLTVERVRQIREGALKKLRSDNGRNLLRDYLS